jgi:hypothetical protein
LPGNDDPPPILPAGNRPAPLPRRGGGPHHAGRLRRGGGVGPERPLGHPPPRSPRPPNRRPACTRHHRRRRRGMSDGATFVPQAKQVPHPNPLPRLSRLQPSPPITRHHRACTTFLPLPLFPPHVAGCGVMAVRSSPPRSGSSSAPASTLPPQSLPRLPSSPMTLPSLQSATISARQERCFPSSCGPTHHRSSPCATGSVPPPTVQPPPCPIALPYACPTSMSNPFCL